VSPERPSADAEGFDLRPDPLQTRSPAEFTAALRQYRAWSGDPSLREIAGRAGGRIAASTIWQALRAGDAIPRMEVVLAVVAGCGGSDEDQRRFVTAWRTIRLTAAPAPPHNGKPGPGLQQSGLQAAEPPDLDDSRRRSA
jgi:hypothetical protein